MERCECDDSTGECECAEGPRGAGALGAECAGPNDCMTGICLNDRCSARCGSGGDCGPELPSCQPILGFCVEEPCTADCGTRVCGDDGCGGSCGMCAMGTVCAAGECVAEEAFPCPGRADGCTIGQACCVTQGTSACVEADDARAAQCQLQAGSLGGRATAFFQCDEDADCAGAGEVCCSDQFNTICEQGPCGAPSLPTCVVADASSCSAGESCCPLERRVWTLPEDPGLGYCAPLSCP